MSPSELIQVQNDGLGLVKIFPASSLGPGFLKSAIEIFPDLLFMPTGGINADQVNAWFNAGASAIGMGGSLISKSSMDNRDFEDIKLKINIVTKQIADIRTSGKAYPDAG